MFCPKCGQQQLLASARFCPSCGFGIAKVKEFLDPSPVLPASPNGTDGPAPVDKITFDVPTPLEKIEKAMILATLTKLGGNKTHTAQLLDISLKTLHNKLTQYRGGEGV